MSAASEPQRQAAERAGLDGEPLHRESGNLQTLLAETRILLPGTQVFLAFLTTIPFSHRFLELRQLERGVYIATFFATMLALLCFETPAAYHRLASPIHHKAQFKSFANAFLVAGLAPVSVSVVLASFLVTSLAIGRAYAYVLAAAIAVVVGVLWWVLPLRRSHDRYTERRRRATARLAHAASAANDP